ncbi:MAG TPA: molybdopterin cofactor-binding domain-containing protein [Acidimicrobiales bacterium]
MEITRRRLLVYATATPTLGVAVRLAADIGIGPDGPDALGPLGGPDPADAQIASIVDFTDALTLAALPTQHLLVVEITTEGRVVARLPRAEVGQGITTAVAQIVAEELDARLTDVDVVLEDARPELLFNQLTGGSNTIHALYGPLRNAAAGARARLVTAAARRWNLPASRLRTQDTAVVAPDGRTLGYGALTEEAARITIPAVSASPKNPANFGLIGQPTTRIDARDIVTGRARYTQDLAVPGALPCVVARPPTIGGTVRTLDDRAARAMPGVVAVTQIPTGVAVVAETFDHALAARDALVVSWNAGPAATLSDADIRTRLRNAVPPFVVPPLGSLTVDRSFDFAFVPHAPMEVLNCVADVRSDRAELWLSAKSPIVTAQTVAVKVGLPVDKVTVHVVRGGGSFGRRLFFDPAIEAALVSKAVGRPVRLMWTRADDTHHGRLRPASHHRARATHLLGTVVGYEHRMGSVTLDGSHGLGEILTAVGLEALGAAGQAMFRLSQLDLYHFGTQTRLLKEVDLPFPTGSWRSVFSGQVRTVDEVMVDEIARALRRDPVELRRAKLRSSRTKAVLDKVATAGNWGKALPSGVAQGVGIHEEYKSVVAYLVELDARDRSRPRVTRAVAAVDVGRAVNPRGLEAQLQGALTDALSYILQAGVHIDGGAVRESSFSDFRYARMRDTPVEVEVHVMPPTGEPGGAGELGVPAAAAAVANAWARATGSVPTRFPIVDG